MDSCSSDSVDMALPRGPSASMKRSLSASTAVSVAKKQKKMLQERFVEGRTDCSQLFQSFVPEVPCSHSDISSLAPLFGGVECAPVIVGLVIALMEKNIENCNIQYSGMCVLNAYGYSSLGVRSYATSLSQAMKAHSDQALVQLEGCRGLLHWMRLDPVIVSEIGSYDHLSILATSLTNHSHLLPLRYCILEIVRIIVASSLEQRRIVASHDSFVSALPRLLRNNLLDSCTLQIGLSILSWIIEEKNSRDILFREGGINVMLQCMKVHPFDEVVHCNGAATLCWLVHAAGASDDTALLSREDLNTILETMKRFLHKPMVLGNLSCVLSGVVVNDPTSLDHAQHLEAVQLCLSGMRTHKCSPKVHRSGFTLLRYMVANANLNVLTLILENLEVLEQVMLLHPEDTAIQAEACSILVQLTSLDGAISILSDSRCIESVFQCQVKHFTNLRVQHAAILFHNRLLEGREVRQEAVDAFGGGFQVLGTMTAGIRQPGIQAVER